MPIYQYDCAGCGRRVDVFFRSISRVADPACPECGGKQLKRAVSQVARRRSQLDRVNSINIDQELGHLDGTDVGSFARWARRMGEQYDGELGSDFSHLADKADAGEDPLERIDPGHTLRYRLEQARNAATPAPEDAGAPADPYAPYP